MYQLMRKSLFSEDRRERTSKERNSFKRSFLDILLCTLCSMLAFNYPIDHESFISIQKTTFDVFQDYKYQFTETIKHLPEINSFQDLKWFFLGDPYLPIISRPTEAEFIHAVNRNLPFIILDTPFTDIININYEKGNVNNVNKTSHDVEHQIIRYLSNITHLLDCQVQQGGESFMYFDQNNDGLLPDTPMVSDDTSYLIGGKVSFESVYLSKWLNRIHETDEEAKYCVEELELSRQVKKFNNLSEAFMPMVSSWIERHIKGSVSDAFANLWLHGKGSVTQGHYDSAQNVLTQLVGTKRVTLIPPASFNCLHLFPSFHPRARKSQIPIYATSVTGTPLFPHFLQFIQQGKWASKTSLFTPNERKFPRFVQYITSGHCHRVSSSSSSYRRVGSNKQPPSYRPYIAHLKAGESISIPPFWFHFVESTNTSISLNVFSKSTEELLYQQAIFNTPLPFENDWPKRMYARACYKFIDMIAKKLNINLTRVVRGLLESKYALSYTEEEVQHDRGSGYLESSKEWLPWCREPSIDATIVKKSSEGGHFTSAVNAISKDLSALKSLNHMAFEEVIENVVATMFGFESIPLFLCTCFTPVPLRDLIHGNEEGPPASLNVKSCVRQWDRFTDLK